MEQAKNKTIKRTWKRNPDRGRFLQIPYVLIDTVELSHSSIVGLIRFCRLYGNVDQTIEFHGSYNMLAKALRLAYGTTIKCIDEWIHAGIALKTDGTMDFDLIVDLSSLWARNRDYCEELKTKIRRPSIARLNELQAMPYQDYLRSPEWQTRRTRSLKLAGYHCQVCNASGVILNVHHRTYERLGYEYDQDLIVLCQDCHHTFHNNRKLEVVR